MNAKKEFLHQVVLTKCKVKSAIIMHIKFLSEDKNKCILRENYTPAEFELFLRSLDFDYDSGFDAQELFGIIWFEDGSWSEREEYDGSEWWQQRKLPIFEEYLESI